MILDSNLARVNDWWSKRGFGAKFLIWAAYNISRPTFIGINLQMNYI